MSKISIIIPVYNTENYLNKCLDSIVNQTFKDIEIILINDGSKDNSKNIMDEYRKKYNNIKIIDNQKNRGIGYSRNIGIKNSSSKYLAFIDSDDYIDKNYLKDLYEYSELNKLDICVCDLKKIDEEGNILGYEKIYNFEITNLRGNPNLLLNINMGPANKLIKKSLFDDYNCKFSENLKYEDMYVLPILISKAEKIGKINNTYYNYVIHSKSETTTMNNKVFDILKVLEKVNSDLKNLKYYNEIKEYVEYLNIRTIFRYTLQQKNQIEKSIKNDFIDSSFDFLDSNFPNWKKNTLWKKNRNFIKRLIEGNKKITKLYVK